MNVFHLNGKKITWDLLEEVHPDTPNEKSVLSFLSDWKNGNDDFEINTSGSTGAPKPIRIRRNLMEKSALRTLRHLGLQSHDHALVCLNAEYIAGKMMLVRALTADMQLTIIDPVSDPFEVAPEGVTFTALVPMQLDLLLKNHQPALSSLRAVLVGGAPVSGELADRCSLFTTPVFETYGMTETLTHVALKRISGPHPEAFFKVLPGIEIKTDHQDCLQIRGDVTERQWIQTQDVVAMQGQDGFTWLGRKDFVINSGGVKIYPEQVEEKLNAYFQSNGWQQRFLVIPVPDTRLGQAVSLLIEGTLPASKERILEELRYRVSPYERPRNILSVSKFPETPTGKIDRRKAIDSFH